MKLNCTKQHNIKYNKMKRFEDYKGSGWGHTIRREVFYAACKYLGQNPTKIENIYGAAFFSVLQSDTAQLTGEGLVRVKNDTAMIDLQNSIVSQIKNDPSYMKEPIFRNGVEGEQLGGQRAQVEMWKQALEVWKWADEYSATWDVAFDELTWLLRTINVNYNAKSDVDGNIIIAYSFSDVFDLRPDWHSRSMEYNAICAVLGFIYHDAIGCNDELRLQANWTVEINNY